MVGIPRVHSGMIFRRKAPAPISDPATPFPIIRLHFANAPCIDRIFRPSRKGFNPQDVTPLCHTFRRSRKPGESGWPECSGETRCPGGCFPLFPSSSRPDGWQEPIMFRKILTMMNLHVQDERVGDTAPCDRSLFIRQNRIPINRSIPLHDNHRDREWSRGVTFARAILSQGGDAA
jgi:hypothetical protein